MSNQATPNTFILHIIFEELYLGVLCENPEHNCLIFVGSCIFLICARGEIKFVRHGLYNHVILIR
jgi:hypothetical protein